MKLRVTLIALASLLLIAALAGAAQTATPANPASATLAAIFTPPAPPAAANADLPSFTPTPTNKAISCGSCSDTACTGKTVGTVCGFKNGQTYKCQLAYEVCAPNDCECWTGPLP